MPYILKPAKLIEVPSFEVATVPPGRLVSHHQWQRIVEVYRLLALSMLVTVTAGLAINTALPNGAAAIVFLTAFALFPILGLTMPSAKGTGNWFAFRFFSLCVVEGCVIGPILKFSERSAPGLSALVGLTSLVVAVSLVAYAFFSRLNYSRWFGFIVCSAIVILVTSVIGNSMKGTLVETACDAGMLLVICGAILYDSSKLLEPGRNQTPVEDASDIHADVTCFFFTLFNLLSRLVTKT